MKRSLKLLPVLLLALSICAFGQIIDPNVGVFDPSAACAPTCGLHPNPIPLTEFGVWNFGNAGAPLPWYIIFAVPDNTGGAPTLSSDPASPDSFTATGPTDAGAYLPTSSQTLYEFAGPSTTLTASEIGAANNSMNTTNMFVGGTPTSFEVYVFSMDPALPSQVAELFDTNIVPVRSLLSSAPIVPGQTRKYSRHPSRPPVWEAVVAVAVAAAAAAAARATAPTRRERDATEGVLRFPRKADRD